jgi:tetratricopeptide (TPR) repeat protein
MNPLQKAAFIFCATVPGIAQACLWDSDTLATESARFPNVAGIMAGVFPRHSKEYHVWRIQQKQPLVESGKAGASDYDDLAVSQHKLGDHKAAIATMMAKEQKVSGLYETYSNLGTFYIYAGELSVAQKWIEKALAINPNAHFGREKYQRWLVMWLRERRSTVLTEDEKKKAPFRDPGEVPTGFAAFVARQQMGGATGDPEFIKFTEVQQDAAIGGVIGMMYFADFDNPILQEALGDLLSYGKMEGNASQLAGLCYLHASEKVTDPEEKAKLKALMHKAVSASHLREEKDLKKTLDSALLKGENLNKGVKAHEVAWIAAGKDVAAEFQSKYLQVRK